MAILGSHRTKVYRRVLTTGAEFEQYVNRIGRPQFAITCVGDPFDERGPDLKPDEWLFADDLEKMMREFFAWDARGVRMDLISADLAERKPAYWTVTGLSDYLGRSARHLNGRDLGTLCKAMGPDGARKAFLEAVFQEASAYGFLALQVIQYNRFISDWKTNDDRKAHPSSHRANKNFGVISATGRLGIEGTSVHYWASIGWTSGWLSEQQLLEVGLTRDALIGQTCVINGLGEVEWVGNIPIPQRTR
ncbi:hypothetical protein D0B32_19885 [Paraburkholderia sp. DHOC27]|nr:hypothetical protein D0B32_19885 [Paraburkholderia sp. DHOC27]